LGWESVDSWLGRAAMFVLLQIYPPEAAGDEDEGRCLDVIAVDASEAEWERYLAGYRSPPAQGIPHGDRTAPSAPRA